MSVKVTHTGGCPPQDATLLGDQGMCAPSIFAGPVMTHAKLLSHAAAAEAEAARWASEGAFLLPLLRRRDAAALRRLALATAPAWGAVHAVREVA